MKTLNILSATASLLVALCSPTSRAEKMVPLSGCLGASRTTIRSCMKGAPVKAATPDADGTSPAYSAARQAGESHVAALIRTGTLSASNIADQTKPARVRVKKTDMVISQTVPYSQFMATLTSSNPTHVADWSNSGVDVKAAFAYVRDSLFFADPEGHIDPNTGTVLQRRSSWLYPDDGCFTRAEIAAEFLAAKGLPKPSKIFVFGNLGVSSANSDPSDANHIVRWSFHVVDLIFQSPNYYVLDPAIEPNGPISVDEWLGRMTAEDNVQNFKLVVCSPDSYIPQSGCLSPNDPNLLAKTQRDQKAYLNKEWKRQRDIEGLQGSRKIPDSLSTTSRPAGWTSLPASL